MNLARKWKALVYPWVPSASISAHDKRRKGLLYRYCPPELLECQQEQDRIFWQKFLHPEKGGAFIEIGGGDGTAGSHTLGLELQHGWKGGLWEPAEIPRRRAARVRNCEIFSGLGSLNLAEPIQLLAVHRPSQFPTVWEDLKAGRLQPRWVMVENREPDPQWCRLLERSGYRLKFFFHDDEYFVLKS